MIQINKQINKIYNCLLLYLIIPPILLFVTLSSTHISYALCNAIGYENSGGENNTTSLKFSCDLDTDFSQNPIIFDISNNIKITEVWNLSGMELSVTQNSEHVTIRLDKYWGSPKFEKGHEYTIKLATSGTDFVISNFAVGNDQVKDVTLQIIKFNNTQSITNKLKIELTPVGKLGEKYNFEWDPQKPANENVYKIASGSYTVMISFEDQSKYDSDKSKLSITPDSFIAKSNTTQTLSIQYNTYQGKICFKLSQNKPVGISDDYITIHIMNLKTSTKQDIQVYWNNYAKPNCISNIDPNVNYSFNADNIYINSRLLYSFNFDPSSIFTSYNKQNYDINIYAAQNN